jgi:hypothetical protein
MNRSLQITLTILLIFNFVFANNAFAELNSDPAKFAAKVISNVKRSVSSIGSINVLSVVRGTVTLLGAPSLSGSVRSIYRGNDFKLKRKKVIKVRGENDGDTVILAGIGRSGDGYVFSFSVPDEVNRFFPGRKKNFGGRIGSVIKISYEDLEVEVEVGRFRGSRSPRAATLKGVFSDKVPGGGTAKGRFNLKFSRR